jgi:predicted amidohydrolase YtcJ
MILENGVIRTMSPTLPTARALAIAGATVAGGVGTHETALPSPEYVDLRGRCVLPAFNDAHVHFPSWALAQREIRLEGTSSLAEALARVADAPRRSWLRGRGWRDGHWELRPTCAALDTVTGAVPTALWAKDYHSLWVNSAALALGGDALAGHGELVERDASGEPTGILREEAAWRFHDEVVDVPFEELVDATRAGIWLAHSRGVAAVHDMDGRIGALDVFQHVNEREGLTLRVLQSLPHERLGALTAAGIRSGLGDPFLRLGHLKVFMDGSLGSQTAAMLDGSGIVITRGDELTQIVLDAAAAGWPVAVHAIGDRANRDVLDAFERTHAAWAPHGLRQRIEHAQCVSAPDVDRYSALGVTCSVQFSHATSDRDLVDRLWADRAADAFPFRGLADSGAVLVNGSDAPVEELDPLAGIVAAVLRTADERPPWQPEQALTVDEAIRATTTSAAWLAGDERRRGQLIPGFVADLVVLDRDPYAIPVDELPEIGVVATMVGGRWLFNPPPWD